jgi:SAM-dependent methyltransferase
MPELYNSLGQGYSQHRRPDARIHRAILRALDGHDSVLNVGAGTGAYEPQDRFVVAVEPSPVMIRQRAPHGAPAIRASAAALPFRDATFDAATAILTIHHWPDWRSGIRELRRAARRKVAILTWDPAAPGFWLVNDYFPEILDADRRIFPPITMLAEELGGVHVGSLPIPHDCSDGFLGAYWRRPAAYLDPTVRQAISTFSKVAEPDGGLARLRRDLRTGAWRRRYSDLLRHESLDLGYRLITTH